MADAEQRLLMLIDDEPAQSRLITALAAREGWRTIVVNDAETAIATLGTRQGMQLSAIILDQWVPGDQACELIAELKHRRPALPILMLTTSTSPLLAVEAMRAGATDYLVKPVAPDRMMQALRNTTTRENPHDELTPLSEKMDAVLDFDAMVGTAPPFRAALARAAKAARGHGSVLIEGESGTGKEMLVRAMHAASPRAKTAHRMINVGGVPASSLESVLFGHEKGAFTGAFDRQVGALQNCDGGTLVLDEVGELPLVVQAKLLRTLQNGEIQRLGADKPRQVDVRIIAATNRNLRESVRDGHFRADLYHRLSVYPAPIPPLRERGNDVLILAGYFLELNRARLGLRSMRLSPAAERALLGYGWPGNVRELEHVISRAALRLLSRGASRSEILTLEPDLLDLDSTRSAALAPVAEASAQPLEAQIVPLREAVDNAQRQAIVQALEASGENWAQAARLLDVDSSNLHKLARRLKLK